MKVKELIEKLSTLDPEASVMVDLAYMEHGSYEATQCYEFEKDSQKMVFIGTEED